MKKLILATVLLSLSTSVFANVIRAPSKICLTNKYDPSTVVKEQLSYPGEDGFYSSKIPYQHKKCMKPYTWKTAPGIFDMYAVFYTGWGLPYFVQCTPGMTIRDGIKKAPVEVDYTLTTDNPNNIGKISCVNSTK